MKDFKKFGGGRGGFDRDKTMFTAICASCGASCQVPFKPNGKKPVYCKNCFGGQEHRPSEFKPSFDRKSFGGRDTYRAPESRTADRSDQLQRQIEALGSKLDKVIDLIKGMKVPSAPMAPAAVEVMPGEMKKAPKKPAKKVAKKTAKKK
jgi:CxxC-x17-CxxC domain-containing protein